MEIHNVRSQQNFGALKFTKEAEDVLKSRISAKKSCVIRDNERKLLNALKSWQQDKPGNIEITMVKDKFINSRKLSAKFLNPKTNDVVTMNENILSKGVDFIKNVCNKERDLRIKKQFNFLKFVEKVLIDITETYGRAYGMR